MTINIPENVRGFIYVIGIIGQPIVAYLLDKGIIGTTEVTLWGALSAAAFLLARINLSTPAKDGDA